jgi:hypothetical protein
MMELGTHVDGMPNNLSILIHSTERDKFVDFYFLHLIDIPINNIVIFYCYIVFFWI